MSRALVERAMAGDHEAFARLAAESIDRLHAIARLVLRDADLAEDAVQEALVKAWRELPRLRDADRFEAWLRRLLVNACHDEGRRRRRILVHQTSLVSDHVAADAWQPIEDREWIRRAFDRLPIDQRVVLVLDQYLGLTDAEIAVTVGIPIGTAKSRLRYAVSAMRAALEADNRTTEPVVKGQIA